MDGTGRVEPLDPKRTRISKACQHCRSLKARCIPSNQPGVCQKCVSSKRTCEWSEQQPRTKRVRTGGFSRISQMEQKLDGLVALLVDPGAVSDPAPVCSRTTSTPGVAAPSISPLRMPARPSPKTRPLPDHGQENAFETLQEHSEPRQEQLPPTNMNDSAIDHEIMRGLLASGRANVLLHEFRAMSDFFPFVPIPAFASAQTLNRDKPMLLLAVLTTAAWRDRPLQMVLSEQFRLELAHRTLVHPRKTMGMIQSILVYLAWYHFHFNPQSQQLHSLLQLAIGLVMDMGIHQRPKKPFIDISGHSEHRVISTSDEREAQRTLLGCYYLSSAFSDALRIPNMFKYTKYMRDCGIRLATDLEYPSDVFLMSMSTLRRIDDQIFDTFLSDEVHDLTTSDPRFQMHVQLLESQLKDLSEQITGDVETRGFDIQYSFANMVLHHAGPRASSTDTATETASQLESLLTCLESGKSFLDQLLAIPASQYHLVSFVEWMRLPYVLIVISRLALPHADQMPTWSVKIAQERVRIDLYLESLCYRMQSLTTFNRDTQPQPDFWLSMVMIMEKTRSWYVRKAQAAATSTTANEESPLETVRDPHDDGSGGLGRSSAVTTPSARAVTEAMDRNANTAGFGNAGTIEEDDFFPAIPHFENLEDFLDGGLWGSGGFDPNTFGGDDMGF